MQEGESGSLGPPWAPNETHPYRSKHTVSGTERWDTLRKAQSCFLIQVHTEVFPF